MVTRRRTFLGGLCAAPLLSVACRPSATADRSTAPACPEPDPGPAPAAAPDPTGGRFASLAGFCDGVPAPDEREFEERRERLRASAKAQGADAALMEAGTNMKHFGGVRWGTSERPLLCLIPVDGREMWVAPAFERDTLGERLTRDGIDLRPWHEHQSAGEVLVQGLKQRSRKRMKVAVDSSVRNFVTESIRTQAGAPALRHGAEVFDGARMRKTDVELARMRRASEATKAAIREVAKLVQPGMGESECHDLMVEAQLAAGLTDIWCGALFGPNAAFPHGTNQRRELQEGDFVLVDTGGALHGYQSDVTRTWAIGKVADEPRRAWETVRKAQAAGLAEVRPGQPCEAADAAARKVMAEAGYGADYERFTHRLGHGIGIQVHEAPYLVRGNKRILEPGMCMSDEPGIYIQGSFGVRLEDIVAVTKDGAEVFGSLPASLEEPFGTA